jgi:hypothetical protein
MKKVLICALTTVMVLSLANSVTYALGSSANEKETLPLVKIEERVKKVDDRIWREIEKSQAKAAGLTLTDNKEELNRIIDNLIEKTNKMAGSLIKKGDKNDIEITADWIEVPIGDQYVWVDPCRVITVSD